MTATVSVLSACSSAPTAKQRILSAAEKSKFGLYGNINDARICPTEFDEKSGKQVVTGRCEVVSCTVQSGSKVECRAVPEP